MLPYKYIMKKLFRILLWIAGIFVGLIVLIVIAFKLFFPVDKAKAYAIEKAEAYLGRKVTIETIDISIWGGLGLQLVDITVSNPPWLSEGYFLTADNIDAKMQFWPLLAGEFRIDRFILNNPQITMHKFGDGNNNYTFVPKDTILAKALPQDIPPETAPAAAAVSFERFEINNGVLDYKDDLSKMKIHIAGLNFQSALENPQENLYQSTGNLNIDSLIYSSAENWPSYAVDMDYAAELDLENQRLTVKEAHVDINDITLQFKGELLNFKNDLNGRVNIKGEQILAQQVLPLLPPGKQKMLSEYALDGKFDLDVDVDYDKRKEAPLYYSGTINLTDVILHNGSINGDFKFRQALIDFKPDNVRANIEGGTFNDQPFKGHIIVNNFDDPFVNGDFTGATDVAVLQPLLSKKGDITIAGNAHIDVKFAGQLKDKKNLKYSGNFSMAGGKFSAGYLPEPIESLSMDLYFDNEVANVRKIAAKSKSANINFEGRFEQVLNYYLADSADRPKMKRPLITGDINGRADMGILNSYLAEKRGGQMSGTVDFKMQISGSPIKLSDLKPHGSMSISNGSLKDTLLPEPIEHLSANFTIVADTFKVDSMKVQFVSSDVSMKGRVVRPVPYFLTYLGVIEGEPAKPLFELNITSKKFDVDKMFPEAVPGSEAVTEEVLMTTEPSMVLPDMNGTGVFLFDTLIYNKIKFSDIKGNFRVQDRKIDCYEVTGNVYSGKVSGKTTIDLNNIAIPQYIGEFKASDVEADDFVKRFSKFGGFIFGKIDVNGNYNASGWNKNEFVSSLTMDGLAQMNKGKLTTSGPTYQAVNAIASSLSLKFDQEQAIRNLATKIKVKDGKVGLDNLKTSLGVIGDIELGGFYDFSGGIQYKGSVLLSPDYTKQVMSLLSKGDVLGGLTGLFTDKSVDRLRLPLIIEGTVDEPKVNVDMAALSNVAGKNLKDKLSGFIKDQFKKEDKK